MSHVLDRCIWKALSGPHTAFGLGGPVARRYRAEYAPFAATIDDSAPSLAALHDILPTAGGVALCTLDRLEFPETIAVIQRAMVVQMVLPAPLTMATPPLPATARDLGADDVPAMLALVGLTQPGPFAERTVALGRYIGIFTDDGLIAMAGERMRVDGFVELSAVCTHPDYRGRMLSAALIGTLARAAFDRGETPFLHAFAHNEPALAVYRRLGFSTRAMYHLAVANRAADRA